MANVLKVKRSATPSAAPAVGDLALGELAVNTSDGKAFFKRDNGTDAIIEILTELSAGTNLTWNAGTLKLDASVSSGDLDTNEVLRATALLHIEDQKPALTHGGSFASGAWRQRVLNTVITNTITNASLASNTITLPTGKYYVSAKCPAFFVQNHKARLYNVTGSAVLLYGTSEIAGQNVGVSNKSFIDGVFELSAESEIRLEHYCQTTANTFGFGIYAYITGVHETYSTIQIWKVGS